MDGQAVVDYPHCAVKGNQGLASHVSRPAFASDMKTKKHVLLVQFSQTGTTRRLAASFCAPLAAHPDIELTTVTLAPARPYPFPWPFFDFFDTFPETVQLCPPALQPMPLDANAHYDLVILSYPVWFLSPAPPMLAFLQSSIGRAIVADTPTITLIGCRNMWLRAHETVSTLLRTAGARHCDHVVVSDPGPSLATFITTPRWMFTGRRNTFLGMPPAGISDRQISAAARFGHAIVHAFEHHGVDGRQPLLSGLQAVTVNDALLGNERIGHRSFRIWSRLLRKAGAPGTPLRRALLGVYFVFLLAMIISIVPLSLAIRALVRRLRPAVGAVVREQYAAPSGSGSERMQQFKP